MTRKRYNVSIPDKYTQAIEKRAKEANMKPTSYLTHIIAQHLDIELNAVGNPNFTANEAPDD